MNIIADLHTHTLVSGHAYSTLKENCEGAKARGLNVLGTTEHGEAMPGASDNIYFRNMRVLRDHIYGIRLLKGAEANIMDYEGALDVDAKSAQQLDYLIASLHTLCLVPGTKEENTAAYLGAMEGEKVRILGHPDDGRYPYDVEKVVRRAKEKGVFLELNDSSLNPENTRENGEENIRKLLLECKKQGAKIAMGTDAHVEYDVGNFQRSLKLLEELDFPEELIVNAKDTEEEFLKAFFEEKK